MQRSCAIPARIANRKPTSKLLKVSRYTTDASCFPTSYRFWQWDFAQKFNFQFSFNRLTIISSSCRYPNVVVVGDIDQSLFELSSNFGIQFVPLCAPGYCNKNLWHRQAPHLFIFHHFKQILHVVVRVESDVLENKDFMNDRNLSPPLPHPNEE